MVAAVMVEWARTRGGGRKDDRDEERVAEPGVRVEAEDEERGGVDELDDEGRDRDNSEEDEGEGDGDGCAVAMSVAAV